MRVIVWLCQTEDGWGPSACCVRDNVRCMIPALLVGTDRNLALWQEHRQQRWQDYQEGKRSFFSEGDEKTQ